MKHGLVALALAVGVLAATLLLQSALVQAGDGRNSVQALDVPTRASFLPVLVHEAIPTPTPTPTVTVPSWLQYVNEYREAGRVPTLAEEAIFSAGGELHSRYMVMEDQVTHYELVTSPYYSVEGDAAARNGNIFVSTWDNAPHQYPIDFWMAAPFHAVGILDPQLAVTGFGAYSENVGYWHYGATLDVARGRTAIPPGTSFPLPFPASGGFTWLTRYNGGEFPDPLTPCYGYSPPTGPGILLQLGDGSLTPHVTAHSFADSSGPLEHCVYDETTYTHPDPAMQRSGRNVLGGRDAVVIMPRYPLVRGETYIASITADGQSFTWHFLVIPPPQPYAMPAEPVAFEMR